MKQYIPKDALVAEIGRLMCSLSPNFYEYDYDAAKVELLEKIEEFIDTLEVKDECIENDFGSFWGDYIDSGGDMNNYEVAKHFFELGLSVSNKAQKGE